MATPSELIALLTPTGRDGAVGRARARRRRPRGSRLPRHAGAVLRSSATAMASAPCSSPKRRSGPRASSMLLDVLGRQAPWSDVPIVVLTGEGELSRAIPRALEELASHANVTLLERPVRVATIVTVLRSALRARRRQYDVRSHLVERKVILERERAARHQAEEANHAKSEFLAMMSHELRTPLNAIGGYAQLIEMGVRGPVTPEQREDLERIERSQRHLLGLINDVLNFAKLEAGRVQFVIGACADARRPARRRGARAAAATREGTALRRRRRLRRHRRARRRGEGAAGADQSPVQRDQVHPGRRRGARRLHRRRRVGAHDGVTTAASASPPTGSMPSSSPSCRSTAG